MKKEKPIRKAAWLLLLLINSVNLLLAQAGNTSRTITGTVTSKGVPLSNVTVFVKGAVGAGNATISDGKGAFSIRATDGNVLVFSSMGYLSIEVKVTPGMSSTTVQLTEDPATLTDVVVVGYGTQKKTDLSSAQTTVTAKDISRTVNTTFDQALQGRSPNVYVTNNSGQPGAATSVVIRGLGSLTGSTQPLYVIDGVQYKPDNMADDPNNRPQGFANLLSSLNPDDIETINILQGPSATSIYGSVGANGVVLVTTKRGKAGETKINLNSLLTLQDRPNRIEVMDLPAYARYRNDVQAVGGPAADPEFKDPAVLGPGTDWQHELFRRTLLNKQSLSLSGGNDKSTFYLSGEYFNQEGIAPGSGFKRGAFRINLDNNARKWLKVGTNLSVSLTNERVNTTNAGVIDLAIRQSPAVAVKNADGSWGGPAVTQFAFSNPIALASINNDYNKALAAIGGIYANVNVTKDLEVHADFNGNYQYRNNYIFHPSYKFGGFVNATSNSSRTASNNYWWGLNARVQYSKWFNGHFIQAMVAHEAQRYGSENLHGYRKDFVTNTVQELSGGDAESAVNNSAKSRGSRESYFGRLNYTLKDRYILQGTYRRDGSSVFGSENRWGGFPSVSAAWRLSKEDFFNQSVKAVNDAKLRVEYGVTGNSNAQGYFAVLQTIPTAFGSGFLSQNFSNPAMQWEEAKTFNVGLDVSLWNNRVQITADAYIKNISRLLTISPYSYFYGGDIAYSPGYLSWPTTNGGSMRNKGIGISVNTVNVSNKQFVWKSTVNFSMDRNKITALSAPINISYNTTQAQFTSRVGEPASMMTGYIAEGLFQNLADIRRHPSQAASKAVSPTQGSWVGDIKFKNQNNDNVIDAADRVVIGNPWPKWTFGFNNAFNYKNFDLNIFITGSVGNDLLNYERYMNEIPFNSGTFANYFSSITNYARPTSINVNDSSTVTLRNPGHNIPRMAPGDPNGNNRMSQWFVESGSYLRVKNIALGYNLPAKLISPLTLKSLRVAVNVQNLFTITGYKGYDPEVGMVNYGGTTMSGLDNGRYPNTRMYSFNLIAEF
ncbi:TonB-linked SusC/RagA family outer membrane protein [Filimonas zeae]|uniref:SusC/RagA family TonB-linked outer membrane protein n=1 Tax=Filimonas zeae TaxID=1737353 RepID=A0A917J0B8_9BACT|nr:TonB-dependent receptor [Filimonas zeae]MDR6340621.1 TonB-linked SusC/RagA family outer membrane protein [Filimonas zeae]GGH73589.1 SusC/RagA family TonB-linked outer membrane protein [Filimonas zeae]